MVRFFTHSLDPFLLPCCSEQIHLPRLHTVYAIHSSSGDNTHCINAIVIRFTDLTIQILGS